MLWILEDSGQGISEYRKWPPQKKHRALRYLLRLSWNPIQIEETSSGNIITMFVSIISWSATSRALYRAIEALERLQAARKARPSWDTFGGFLPRRAYITRRIRT